MNILAIIGVLLKLILAIFSAVTEKDKEVKAQKTAASKEIVDAISKRDPSAISAGFDKLNRL